jgi:LysR family transcriptional regulator, glycine cleavage system transcriptional activator
MPLWREMPPLSALRAFEAAARNLGFAPAARELNVTHPAVVQQVRQLETHLGLSLIQRNGRGLALTEPGARLAQALADGFGAIAATVKDLQVQAGQRALQVTLTPSFATSWLMPRLGAFWTAHPDLPIALHPTRRHVDLAREGFDLAIRFGTGDWPGLQAAPLVIAPHVVVAAPSLVPGTGNLSLDDLRALPWVLERDWPEQLVVLSRIGLDPATLRVTEVETEELARAAVRQGYGLHMEASALVEDDVAAGRLRALHQSGDPALGYWLVTRPGHEPPALRTFLKWIRSVA